MFDLSFGKLIIVALIALIVLGPEKLPKAARTTGALIRRVRSGWDTVRAEVERELEVEEIRKAARQAAADAEAVQAEASSTLKKLHEELGKVRQIQHQLDDTDIGTTPRTRAAIDAPEEPPVTGNMVENLEAPQPDAGGHQEAG